MRVRVLYIIIVVIALLGLRIFNQYRSEYSPVSKNLYHDLDSLFLVDTGVVCIMIPKKTNYRIGESPQLDILVINRTDSAIYLPHSLDGSDFNRLPYCNIHFIDKRIFTGKNFADFNNGLMKISDLHILKPNEYFNPIDNVELSDLIPNIKTRTNGFSSGAVKKGFFILDKFGKTRLLISSNKSSYLIMTKNNSDKIIVNFKDKTETEKLFIEIKTLINNK
jgi:hypothetical protein